MYGAERPLSPHLQVYRWRINMWLSSLHRVTGALLSLGAIVLAGWLIALADGPQSYEGARQIVGSSWFKVPLIVWTFCFFLHLSNGVRHLFWDAGLGFDRARIRASGWAVLIVAVAATALYAAAAIV
jgi:succinate dehydrogenase / fumarate reductase cytochrome b subunit